MATAVLLVFGAVVLLSGILMFRAGYWRLREGDEPYCRHCGYTLVGIDSRRCPECGTELNDETVVHGRSIRRRGLVFAGVVVIFAGAGTSGWSTFDLARHVDWYQFKPSRFVLRDLHSTNPTTALNAIRELDRRRVTGSLSAANGDAVVEFALQQQATAPRTQLLGELMTFAGRECEAGKLSQQQIERFGHQCVRLGLNVPTRVGVGAAVPYVIVEESRTPISPFWTELSNYRVYLDGKSVPVGASSSQFSGIGASGSTMSNIPGAPVGNHRLRLVIHVAMRSRSTSPPTVLHEEDQSLDADFEVVPSQKD